MTFPRIWVPSGRIAICDQLLWHRHRMVRARTRMIEPVASGGPERRSPRKKKLWRESGRKQLEAFRLAPWASGDAGSAGVAGSTEPDVAALSQAIEQEVRVSGGPTLEDHPE